MNWFIHLFAFLLLLVNGIPAINTKVTPSTFDRGGDVLVTSNETQMSCAIVRQYQTGQS